MLDFLYNFLSGIGFNDPLHPPITHIPIGLTVGAFLFFLGALIFKKKRFVLTARHTSILGFVFAFPTILLGAFDWIHFYHAALINPIIIKMTLAFILLISLGTGIIIGNKIEIKSLAMTIIYAIAFVCVIGLGYLGAGIVFGRGVSKTKTGLTKETKAGQEIFIANCQACHINGGNSINPEYPLKTSLKLKDKALFIEFIRHPTLRDGLQGPMPSFSEKRINKKEAEELYSYIKTVALQEWNKP